MLKKCRILRHVAIFLTIFFSLVLFLTAGCGETPGYNSGVFRNNIRRH